MSELGLGQTTILHSGPLRLLPLAPGEACLVRIYPTGTGMGTRFVLGDRAQVIGRGTDCEIHIDDPSVSRRHVSVQFTADGYVVVDLESTNGTFLNNVPVTRGRLKDGDYLRAGNYIFRFLAGGNLEAEYHEEIHRLAIIDGLTEIANKRYMLEFLERELARSNRYHRPLTLLLFDIDHFKGINDEFGHLGGDYVLHELAACVKSCVRAEELFARYGGEEFAIVLPETSAAEGQVLGERIRTLVEQHPFRVSDRVLQVTISLGVATRTGQDAQTAAELIARADERLYQAKRAGRNRLTV
jgi:diguanylate cyclase (GGDEF)-like protein